MPHPTASRRFRACGPITLPSLLLLAACATGGPQAPAEPPPADLPGDPPSAEPPRTPEPPAAREPPPPAPWSAEPLRPTRAPRAFLQAWAEAENRESCALLAPADVSPAGAEPRRAHFGGGWGVAYDLPDQRSAFGVAGTGVEPDADTYDEWPHTIRWADGSRAGYGPEGGTGPNQLAYLRVEGQACLYNVWSRLGVEHLEALLAELRFVESRFVESP